MPSFFICLRLVLFPFIVIIGLFIIDGGTFMIFKYQLGTDGEIYQDALSIRRAVFIDEQQVSESLEIDGYDDQCWHLVGYIDGVPIVTARFYTFNHSDKLCLKLQRIATSASYRHQGYGRALMEQVIEWARQQNISQIHLSSQLQAIGFYQTVGFQTCNDVIYLDAGIEHQDMIYQVNQKDL